LEHLCCSEVSISPLFRWPNSVCHFNAPKFAAGEVFGLQEASGMKGVLFRAKDAIKEKFGARWLPAKAKNSDFPGNWWIIETKHNVADVLAVIQQYA
jgi:hypothetical protein